MAEVKVLIEGNHNLIGDKVYLSSTATLVKSQDKNILVDTSHIWDEEKLLTALKGEELTPKDIDIVILTHTHMDHTANLHLFRDADIYAKFIGGYPGQHHIVAEKCIERFEIKDGIKVTDEVEYLFTPGHAIDSLSVIIETDQGKVVIAGDAIAAEKWADTSTAPEDFLLYDSEKYRESREKILKIADYIVPGHGKMFKVKK